MSEQGKADRPSGSPGIGSGALARRAETPPFARSTATWWLGLGLALLAVSSSACSETGRPRGSSESASDGDAGPVVRAPAARVPVDGERPPPPPRRPSRRYFVASSGERCEMYWEQGEQRGEPVTIPCPREMAPGERIRLTGQVCLLEGHNRAAGKPVRCPAKLVALELHDRGEAAAAADAGRAP